MKFYHFLNQIRLNWDINQAKIQNSENCLRIMESTERFSKLNNEEFFKEIDVLLNTTLIRHNLVKTVSSKNPTSFDNETQILTNSSSSAKSSVSSISSQTSRLSTSSSTTSGLYQQKKLTNDKKYYLYDNDYLARCYDSPKKENLNRTMQHRALNDSLRVIDENYNRLNETNYDLLIKNNSNLFNKYENLNEKIDDDTFLYPNYNGHNKIRSDQLKFKKKSVDKFNLNRSNTFENKIYYEQNKYASNLYKKESFCNNSKFLNTNHYSTNPDDTDYDLSDTCQFSNSSSVSSKKRRIKKDQNKPNKRKSNNDKDQQGSTKSSKKSNDLNDALPNILNDIIFVLTKYFNKKQNLNVRSTVSKISNKNNVTSKLERKCTKLMSKKFKQITIVSHLTKYLSGNLSVKLNRSLLESLLTDSNCDSSSNNSRLYKKKKSNSTESISSMYSSDSSIKPNNKEYNVSQKKIDYKERMNFYENYDSKSNITQVLDNNNEEKLDENKSDSKNKTSHHLEIPNIDDPILFIDNLYNQLISNNHQNLINNEEDIEMPEKVKREIMGIEEEAKLSCEIDSSFDSEFSHSENVNDDQFSSKMNITQNEDNELSIIDCPYTLNTISSGKESQCTKDYINPNLIDWNYEEETDCCMENFEDFSEFTDSNKTLEISLKKANELEKNSNLEIDTNCEVKQNEDKEFINNDISNSLITFVSNTESLITSSSFSIFESLPVNLETNKNHQSAGNLNYFNSTMPNINSQFVKSIGCRCSTASPSPLSSCSFISNSMSSINNSKTMSFLFNNSPKQSISSIRNNYRPSLLITKNYSNNSDPPPSTAPNSLKILNNYSINSIFTTFYKSFRLLLMTKNILILPIIILLLNSKFRQLFPRPPNNFLTTNILSYPSLANSAATSAISSTVLAKFNSIVAFCNH